MVTVGTHRPYHGEGELVGFLKQSLLLGCDVELAVLRERSPAVDESTSVSDPSLALSNPLGEKLSELLVLEDQFTYTIDDLEVGAEFHLKELPPFYEGRRFLRVPRTLAHGGNKVIDENDNLLLDGNFVAERALVLVVLLATRATHLVGRDVSDGVPVRDELDVVLFLHANGTAVVWFIVEIRHRGRSRRRDRSERHGRGLRLRLPAHVAKVTWRRWNASARASPDIVRLDLLGRPLLLGFRRRPLLF
mmetsp:Transcript_29569/g.58886  ORF Transcript_29569/g.58886 Transcript_29569/m.58886 type:complete len:248 (-) Transcript_29569:1680-2423(-)